MSATAPPPTPSPEAPKPPPRAAVPTADDHLPGSRRLTARHAIVTVLAAFAILVVCDGDGIRSQGEKLDPGLERTVVLGVGRPAGWIADQLPFAPIVDQMTGWLSPDDDLSNSSGKFTATGGSGGGRVVPQAFDPRALGLPAAKKPPLHTLLVTGDSMSQPMDNELARALAPDGVRTIRDPKFGTGISKSDLLDWGRYAGVQARRDPLDATVVLLGANEGFPMKTPQGTVTCCDTKWAAEYATRVRSMMASYGRGGKGRVYWLLIPISSDGTRNRIINVVNTTIKLAAAAYGDQVRVVDLPALLTPGGKYRSAMQVGGRPQVVRDPDGAHLNELGGRLAADLVRKDLARDFAIPAK
jgi:hypothetical protein